MTSPRADDGLNEPVFVRVTNGQLLQSPQIRRLVDEVRLAADRFIFLSGGASNMGAAVRAGLTDLLGALPILVDRNVRIAVGDGGTRAGVMEAAGMARRQSSRRFPLIGVAPALEVTTTGELGKTPIDPNHSHIVAVDNPGWIDARRRDGWLADQGYWGSEVDAMFELFESLCRDRPSVAIVANGGTLTIDEVQRHIDAERKVIVIAGSGRLADTLASLLRRTPAQDDEVSQLSTLALSKRLLSRPHLYSLCDMSDGPAQLADSIADHFGP